MNISLCREFDEQQFLEYVGPCFKHSAELLQSAAEFDSQLEVFNLVNLIIDRLADGVKPYAEGLLQLMPTVWQASEGQSLLRIQVCICLYSCISPTARMRLHHADKRNIFQAIHISSCRY